MPLARNRGARIAVRGRIALGSPVKIGGGKGTADGAVRGNDVSLYGLSEPDTIEAGFAASPVKT